MRDGIWYPNLRLREKGIQLGKYGSMRLEYLKHHKNSLYYSLLVDGELYGSCKKTETQAQEMFDLEYESVKDIGYSNVEAELYAQEIILKYMIFE